MADQLYLSLWYPNFRMSSLGAALLGVLRQFAVIGAVKGLAPRVRAATVYPIAWSEPPIYQRIYDEEIESAEHLEKGEASLWNAGDAAPEAAVPAALEALFDDFAYEFEVAWELWAPVASGHGGAQASWQKQRRPVRVVGFGPQFDDGAYEQNGQVRVDFGLDTPFLQEDVALDPVAAEHVRENVQLLVDYTNAVQKNCGIATRLLWSESGESLAQKLIARLQQVN